MKTVVRIIIASAVASGLCLSVVPAAQAKKMHKKKPASEQTQAGTGDTMATKK